MDSKAPNDDSNIMDAEQLKLAVTWIEKKWQDPKICEICKTVKWTMQDRMVTPLTLSSSIVLGGTVYPQVMLICDNCGNTKYFNAVMMGIQIKKQEVENGK